MQKLFCNVNNFMRSNMDYDDTNFLPIGAPFTNIV